MADFISSLNGVQMDSALMDMAEHTSEAYAIGERNGVPVGSDDVAYHNNARYYAQQAQSIAPASVTEAVRWDVAQTALTDANREQARDNIEATGFNTNIFRNPWFNVNSRNFTTASVNGTNAYTVDGWRLGGIGTATKNSNGTMTLTITASNYGSLTQYIDPKYMGETLRHSVMLADGTVYSLSGQMPSASGLNIYSYTINGATWQVLYRSDGTSLWVEFRCNVANTTLNIKAFKLEKSGFSTLKFDTPPDYGEELTRCIYSTADPTDPYANNGFGRSNENLLMNPFFTVNQRGFTSMTVTTSATYCVDRWMLFASASGAGTVTRNTSNNVLTINNSSGTSTIYIRQPIPDIGITGKTITVSCMTANGSIYSATGVVPSATSSYQSVASVSINANVSAGFTVASSTNAYPYIAQINITAGGTVDIKALKVEIGTVSTLANDIPPDYATELAKCQRYFRRIKEIAGGTRQICTGMAVSSTMARFTFPFAFRSAPSVAYINAQLNYSGTIAISSINTPKITSDTVTLEVNATSITAPAPIELQLASGGYIDLSADYGI